MSDAVPAPDAASEPLIGLVVPVFDEEDCIEEFVRRAQAAARAGRFRCEILFVDDGSRDATPQVIARLRAQDPSIQTLRFTRNFGHQAALSAGLAHARGDAVVTLDGDLQHPPELLPALVDAWRAGALVVHTVRKDDPRLGWKGRFGRAFYRAMNLLASVPLEPGSADFRLLDRRAVEAFREFGEYFVFVRGLIPWMGFRSARIEYEPGDRFAGEAKYRLWSMLRLALDGIFSFSILPLRLITLLGLATTLFGVGFAIFWLVAYFLGGVEGSNWTSIVILILIFGGVQLLSLGIVSEYVGRIYEEVKRRPRYVIESSAGVERR